MHVSMNSLIIRAAAVVRQGRIIVWSELAAADASSPSTEEKNCT